jgi:hypothetical protein
MSNLVASNSDNDIVGAVYVATNDPHFNSVMMFQRQSNGMLTTVPGSPFLTGGQGTGTGFELPPDPIGSQNSLIVDEKSKFLFVVNTGSNEISSFKIQPDELKLVSTVSSGGVFPNSLTVYDNKLYVVNSADTFNVTGFKIDSKGRLKPLRTCELLPPVNQAPIVGDNQPIITIVPGQIGFSPDGRHLVVVRKEGVVVGDPFAPLAGPGRIDVYNLNKCGYIDCDKVTSNINTRFPSGQFPFSFVFSEDGYLLVTEVEGAVGTPPNSILAASAASSYKLKSNGKLEIISASVPNGATATCWNDMSGNFMYTSNNLSNSLSLYEVDTYGTLELINAEIVTLGPSDAPGFPLDMKVTCDGKYLYVLSTGVIAEIYVYEVNKHNGNLTLLQTVSVGQPFAGQSGLAIADF